MNTKERLEKAYKVYLNRGLNGQIGQIKGKGDPDDILLRDLRLAQEYGSSDSDSIEIKDPFGTERIPTAYFSLRKDLKKRF